MIVSPAFAAKRYAVLGLARSGAATVETLLASGAEVTGWDIAEGARAAFAGRIRLADPLDIALGGFDGLVVSPGVPLNRHPVAARARDAGVALIGDIELFAQAQNSLARAHLPGTRIIGITGTNGKSTTTALTAHILAAAGLPVRMGGNIGLPILGQPPLPPGGVYVLELSSYQIDLTASLGCDAAALINISPDHLDRYDGFAGYAAAKARLFEMQTAGQIAVFGDSDATTRAVAADVAAARPGDVRIADGAGLTGQADWPSLQGPHNLQNVAVAIALVEAMGVAEPVWRPALSTFTGLPHRMERVAEAGGVLFVNDSKATNPASAAPALAAYPRVHWIVGGLPKGDDLDECAPNFGHVVAAYTIGEAGPHFAEILAPHLPVSACEMLSTAIDAAMAAAQPGDTILLSPACASFDQFKDYEARGDCFRQLVLARLEQGPAE